VEEPKGLVYRPELITRDEEIALVALLDGMELFEVTMHGRTTRRKVRHFGYDYDYDARTLRPAQDLPPSLVWLRDRGAELAQIDAEDFVEALISEYPPGATIGWHRDAPMFGSRVVGISLLAPSRMRFQRRAGGVRYLFELELAPRSAYLLQGAARYAWQHSIPPVKNLRYSITFRTIRNAAPAPSRSGR
jgi:alkylated DNA repair protein (DNA oxidative demethylase)